jgi:cell division protein FtsL
MGEKLMAIEIHFEKRIVNQNVVREADGRSIRDYIVVTALAALFLFGLFVYGWQHYQWIQFGYRIQEAQKKREHLVEMGQQLRLERAALRSLQRIDLMARRDLGMILPLPGQVVTLRADAPMTIPPSQTPQTIPPLQATVQSGSLEPQPPVWSVKRQ